MVPARNTNEGGGSSFANGAPSSAPGAVPGGASSQLPGQQVGGGVKRPAGFFKTAGGAGTGVASAAQAGGVVDSPPPVEYTMLIHPPLVVENLLPHAGDFELVDQVRGWAFRRYTLGRGTCTCTSKSLCARKQFQSEQ